MKGGKKRTYEKVVGGNEDNVFSKTASFQCLGLYLIIHFSDCDSVSACEPSSGRITYIPG